MDEGLILFVTSEFFVYTFNNVNDVPDYNFRINKHNMINDYATEKYMGDLSHIYYSTKKMFHILEHFPI